MVVDAFRRFRALCDERLPDNPAHLPGAAAHELADLEGRLAQALPSDLRTLLGVSAGQQEDELGAGPLNHLRFLTVDEIGEWRTMLTESVGDLAEPVAQPSWYARTVWSPHWIPFMGFNGELYCVDLEPGTTGTVGQVFYRPNVPDLNPPVARSLADFLHRAVHLVESGDAYVDGGTFVALDLY